MNEPVAWARQDGVIAFHKKPEVDSQGFKWFALYTHPVSQYKAITNTKIEPTVVSYTHPAELTDEEIMNIFNNWTNNKQEHNLPANNQNYFYQEMREFARAILRKASEK